MKPSLNSKNTTTNKLILIKKNSTIFLWINNYNYQKILDSTMLME